MNIPCIKDIYEGHFAGAIVMCIPIMGFRFHVRISQYALKKQGNRRRKQYP